MQKFDKIFDFFTKIEKLKLVVRQVSVSDNSRKENPAEHTWRMAVMAITLHREFNLSVDLLKTLEIILVHDIIEIEAGDVWNVKNNPEIKKQKDEEELLAAEKIYALLPKASGEELKNLWLEYLKQSSEEARFARAVDRLEVVIQRLNLGKDNWERSDICEILYHWADEAIGNFPKLLGYWEDLQKRIKKECLNK